MNEHVLDWVGAYHDGELRGDRLRGVEAHLRVCGDCQAKLEALQNLAMRLQANPPMPARTPPEQFVAQVRLRMAPRMAFAPGRVRQATGLWLPLGVLALWALGQAVLMVCGLVLGVAALPPAALVVLPPLPGLVALPLLAALEDPGGWGGWLALLGLNAGLTAVAAGLAWGCMAGWWAARETNLASSGMHAG
jgi:anti-sigma factor RsiW